MADVLLSREQLALRKVRPVLGRRSTPPLGATQRPRSLSLNSTLNRRITDSAVLDRLSLDVPARLGPSRVDGLTATLLGSIVEVEQDLKALESETDEDSDSGDEEATLQPEQGRQESSLADFINQARAYVDHVKAVELPNLGFRPAARLAEMRQAVVQADPCAALSLKEIDISSFIEHITKKLERMHESLTALVSVTSPSGSPKRPTVPLPGSELCAPQKSVSDEHGTSTDMSPTPIRPSLPRRYTLTMLYASVPSMPSPLPAMKAFLVHEAIRLSNSLPPTLLRRPSFARLPDDLDELMSRAKENFDHFAEGFENVAAEAKKEFRELIDEAERMKMALQAGAKRLLRYDELPQAWQNNPHILSGYRFIPIERWGEILISFFQWHNETVNVWSHALGAASLIYGVIFVHPGTPQAQSDRPVDGYVTLMFLYTAIACLSCSSVWHLFSGCGSVSVFNNCACLDYVGISALITGSVVSLIYYGFYCEPQLAQWYISFSLAVGIAGIVFPWQAWFNEARHKGTRIAFFLALCGSAVIPQVHMALKYGVIETIRFYAPVALSALAYICGLVLYASNIPERLRPGPVFDHVAHSHQFWHLAIVAAIYTHWWATVEMFKNGTRAYSCS